MPQTSRAPSRPISAGRKGEACGAPSELLGGTGSGTVGKTGFVTESGDEGEATDAAVAVPFVVVVAFVVVAFVVVAFVVVTLGVAVAVAAADALRVVPKGVPVVAPVARVVGPAVASAGCAD